MGLLGVANPNEVCYTRSRFAVGVKDGTTCVHASPAPGDSAAMDAPLSPARRDELIEMIARRLHAWNLNAPAILFLQLQLPLTFLNSQLLLAMEPFVGLVMGDRLACELAFLWEEPENIERLIARLEN